MKPGILFILLLLLPSKISFSQEVKKPVRYKYTFDAEADARKDVEQAIVKAKATGKRVFVIVGGDWDSWSRMADDLLADDAVIDKEFVYCRVNFSPSNKNADVLKWLSCPRDMGYPIFIVLGPEGNVLATQDGESYKILPGEYNTTRLFGFVRTWAVHQ